MTTSLTVLSKTKTKIGFVHLPVSQTSRCCVESLKQTIKTTVVVQRIQFSEIVCTKQHEVSLENHNGLLTQKEAV